MTELPRRRRVLTPAPSAPAPAATHVPERPARRAPAGRSARADWGAVDQTVASTSNFVNAMELGAEWTVLQFLEEKPFDHFAQHWFEEVKIKGWRCLGDDCPLCGQLADDPKSVNVYWNVMSLGVVGSFDPAKAPTPTLEVFRATKPLYKIVKGLNADRRFDGIADPEIYFAFQKLGKKSETTYPNEVVKARDLTEDWGFPLPSPAMRDALLAKARTEPIDPAPSLDKYQQLVTDLLR